MQAHLIFVNLLLPQTPLIVLYYIILFCVCQVFFLFVRPFPKKPSVPSAFLHKKRAFTDTVFMQKHSIYRGIFSIILSLSGLCACHTTADKPRLTDENSSSSQHFPAPLPLLPDETDPSLPDVAPLPPQPATPHATDEWDVSDVDVYKIDKNKKLIAFTFDDAPARSLENILAVYADFNESNPDCPAFATLFVNGCRFTEQSPTLLHAALTLGMELGNHTYSHADLTTLSPDDTKAEIDRVDDMLFAIDGKRRHLFRPPYGKMKTEQKEAAKTPIISWTIDTLDWTGTDEDNIYQSVMQNKFSGAIVLMHDGYANTVRALKRLLSDLKAEGYQVVSVSQMSKVHACPLQKGKEYIRARKR